MGNASVEVLDVNDYEMPIFSEDREKELGQHETAKRFLEKIRKADFLIIAYAEHNGSFTAAYKNLLDWTSRIEHKIFQDKPTLMLATSLGAGASVLNLAERAAPYFGANVRAVVSVPNFHENFDISGEQVTNPEIRRKLQTAVRFLVESELEFSTHSSSLVA